MNITSSSQFYNVGYCGGSGGFIFLHFLLLSEQYYCSFGNNQISLDEIIKNQWNIKNNFTWKKTEVWPSNVDTINSDKQLCKIYSSNKEIRATFVQCVAWQNSNNNNLCLPDSSMVD